MRTKKTAPTVLHQQDPAPYHVDAPAPDDDAVVAHALRILERRVLSGPVMDKPQAVKDYLILRAANMDVEHFACLWLTQQHVVIACETMFTGTLAQTSVYPREIVRRALQLNAAAVILTHNHPSGNPEQSRADEYLTRTLKDALALVDVRVLDHIITGGGRCLSFAERGLL
jgi:DNA repair protein RadC